MENLFAPWMFTDRNGRLRLRRMDDAAKRAMFRELAAVATVEVCQIWQGSIAPNGYGTLHFNGRTQNTHRVLWELVHGPIPPGLVLNHWIRDWDLALCLRSCLNWRHLEVCTQQDNTLLGHGPSAEAARQTHCKRGHQFSPENTFVCRGGARECRICHRERGYAFRARRRDRKRAFDELIHSGRAVH